MYISIAKLVEALVILTVLGVGAFVTISYYRVQIRRNAALKHMPQPDEIWAQGDGVLYIDSVGPHGVEWMTLDPISRSLLRHKDTWDEWHRRLKAHNVWYTGQKRPLGNS